VKRVDAKARNLCGGFVKSFLYLITTTANFILSGFTNLFIGRVICRWNRIILFQFQK